ncbi:hypothetical protein VTK73DRAFT_3609 [Phialemonium thermophilum]|uniref:Uncharacterized protein n=1 Tax=Phialemonium thermophilum TaxID=223376 RepID=A0ABR3WY57_9PEZI
MTGKEESTASQKESNQQVVFRRQSSTGPDHFFRHKCLWAAPWHPQLALLSPKADTGRYPFSPEESRSSRPRFKPLLSGLEDHMCALVQITPNASIYIGMGPLSPRKGKLEEGPVLLLRTSRPLRSSITTRKVFLSYRCSLAIVLEGKRIRAYFQGIARRPPHRTRIFF